MRIKKIVVEKADRLYQMPPELASFVPGRERQRPGRTEIVDLASFPWPIEFDDTRATDPTDLYPAPPKLLGQLREALADWYHRQHGVRLDPDKEIYLGAGITGIFWQLAFTFLTSGDIVFVPELGLPLYRRAAVAAGSQPVDYVVSSHQHWLPEFERINTRLGRVGRMVVVNSPHNPTGAVLTAKEFEQLAWLASKENLAVVVDSAYATLSGRKPTSLLALAAGRKVGLELGSFAYAFGLPGSALGFAAGHRDMIGGLKQTARLAPASPSGYYVRAAIDAIGKFPSEKLRELQNHIGATGADSLRLMEALGLGKAGFDAVPFVWARLPMRRSSTTAAGQLFRRGKIQCVPGVAFGSGGEGFLRFSLTVSGTAYRTALERASRKLPLLSRRGRK